MNPFTLFFGLDTKPGEDLRFAFTVGLYLTAGVSAIVVVHDLVLLALS
jgi:hypothetical protein